jgi:hypothetical protein
MTFLPCRDSEAPGPSRLTHKLVSNRPRLLTVDSPSAPLLLQSPMETGRKRTSRWAALFNQVFSAIASRRRDRTLHVMPREEMTADELVTLVARRCSPRDTPLRLPSDADWQALETAFGCKFPPLFYELHRLYSLYQFYGEWLPVAADIDPLSPDTPVVVAELEQEVDRVWDDTLVPIYALGNGDYVCLRSDEGATSRVMFADHENNEVSVLKKSLSDFLADPDWTPRGA